MDRTLTLLVRNWVKEIKNQSDIEMGHVNTKENLADVATRGANQTKLYIKQEWWHGPEWLADSVESHVWPHSHTYDSEILPVSKDENTSKVQTQDHEHALFKVAVINLGKHKSKSNCAILHGL